MDSQRQTSIGSGNRIDMHGTRRANAVLGRAKGKSAHWRRHLAHGIEQVFGTDGADA